MDLNAAAVRHGGRPCQGQTRTCPSGHLPSTTSHHIITSASTLPHPHGGCVGIMTSPATFLNKSFDTPHSGGGVTTAPGNRTGTNSDTTGIATPEDPTARNGASCGGGLTGPRPGPTSPRPRSSTTTPAKWRSWNEPNSIATVPATVGGTSNLERVSNLHGYT